ncbi:MAG: triose-phosphate isomerase [Bdellovibrionota bacterium]
MHPLFVANWKMNMTGSAVRDYATSFRNAFTARDGNVIDAVFAPPYTAIAAVADALGSTPGVAVGAQNVHWLDSGPHTGEISPVMLRELGVRYAIVGHSERRQVYGETDEFVSRRAKNAIKHNIRPIVCVGEALYFEHDNDAASGIVREQLRGSLKGLNDEEAKLLVVAYEPVWAIGTGRAATPDIVARVHHTVRSVLRDLFDATGQSVPILYGGSTTPDNISAIMLQKDVNGALVGSTSLKPDEFAELIKRGRSAQQ